MNYHVAEATAPTKSIRCILELVEQNSQKWTESTSVTTRKQLGQVFTPLAMSLQLSSLLPRTAFNQMYDGINHIIDPGAGTGILSTTLVSRFMEENPQQLKVTGFEIDKRLKNDWLSAWEFINEQSTVHVDATLLESFTEHADHLLSYGYLPGTTKPQYCTVNPPYIKLGKNSDLSQTLSKHGIPVPNMYAAFIALCATWLEDDGHMLCVIPRSFSSGDYFKHFRKWLGNQMSVEHVVLYRSRTNFKNVLQETILLYMRKSTTQSTRVRITVADTPMSKPEYDLVLPSEKFIGAEGWWLPRSASDIEMILVNKNRPYTLQSLGITMSTGKVELHRISGNTEVPVIYSKDFDSFGNWTWNEERKPRHVLVENRQILKLPQSGGYVLLKRISSNDSPNGKRLFPAFLSRQTVGMKYVGIENHVQYFHRDGQPLSNSECIKLIAFLNSDEANAVISSTGGTTQINCADISKLRLEELK